jgi:hypothetical protein
VHVNPDDLRTIKAFLPSGEEIGVLTASTGWDRTVHDTTLRQNVLRAVRERILTIAPGEDVIQSYLVLKAQQALERRDAKRGRRHGVSPEATALARAVHVSAQSVPSVTPRPPRQSGAPVTRQSHNMPAPSFVPQVRHRGVLK